MLPPFGSIAIAARWIPGRGDRAELRDAMIRGATNWCGEADELVSLSGVPTLLRSGPYRLFFYASDGREPAHVHVQRDRKRAKVWLVRVQLDWSEGFGPAELGRIVRLVRTNRDMLLGRGNEFFET